MDLTYEIPEAIKSGVLVPELKGYSCIETDDPAIDIECYTGRFCQIYPLEKKGGKKKCLRLWFDNRGMGTLNHVIQVGDYFSIHDVKYVIPYHFYDKALRLNNGIVIPGVVMDWIEGEKLIDFVRNHYNEFNLIANISSRFYNMIKYLNDNGMSHGDLSGDNILVKPNGELCLVDYDSFYFPECGVVKQPTSGMPCYQHPDRKTNMYLSKTLDYFSQQVVYLSLLAIEKKTVLGRLIGEEELLFSAEDFRNQESFINSIACKEIVKTNDPELLFRLNELRKSISQPLDSVQSVCQYIEGCADTIAKNQQEDVRPPTKFKWNYCPYCSNPLRQKYQYYYKPNSKFCHVCGKARK